MLYGNDSWYNEWRLVPNWLEVPEFGLLMFVVVNTESAWSQSVKKIERTESPNLRKLQTIV